MTSRRFSDLPWRTRWWVRRVLLAMMGPPQLSGDADPVVRLEREKAQRHERRGEQARRGGQGRMDP